MKEKKTTTILFIDRSLAMQILLTAAVCMLAFFQGMAQTSVTGRVTDGNQRPLQGVSVVVKGTSNGTTTDTSGSFSLSVPGSNSVLVFSYVGYVPQEVRVGTNSNFNVGLAQSTTQGNLDEVVVIGYGTANRRDLTGSISKVSGREVATRPNTNPIASLQGKVAGMSVVNSGVPGQEPDIRIRGTISRYQTKPLYVVDGLLNDNINFVNPADIESIEVLKDASSLAIFGVRGANGVIIVTTKRARAGQVSVNFTTTTGIKNIVDRVELTNAAEFRTLFDEQRANQDDPAFTYYNLFQGDANWVDLIANKNAVISTNNLSLTSGSDRNRFYMGLGYIKEEGLIKYENLNKLLLTLTNELTVSKALKFGFTFNGYRAMLPQVHSFSSAINATPIVEPFNRERGVYNKLPDEIGGPQIGNPLMGVEETRNTNLQREYRAVGSIFGEVSFLRNFSFRATLYGDLGFNSQRSYTPLINVYAAEVDQITPQQGFVTTSVFQRENTVSKFQQDYLLTYKKDLGDHGLTVMGGFTTYYNSLSETSGGVRQYQNRDPIPNDRRWWYLNVFPFGDPSSRTAGSDQWEQTNVSLLFRGLYNFQSKYLVNLSFRRDGSSEISPENRFQNFGAVGLGWVVTRENFMADQRVVNYLKLKGSWGVLGNQFVGIHYPYLPQLAPGQTAVFGNNIVPAYRPAYLADPNLQWEQLTSSEAGFELYTFRNRLFVDAVYYHKLTDNLLTDFPGVSGTPPGITNAGRILNRGIEATASWTDKIGSLGYSIGGNITTLNNTVQELYQPGFEIVQGPSRTTAGFPIGYFYGYVHNGLYQSISDKLRSPNAASLGEYGPGDIKFADLNNDGKIDENDRTIIGNPTPDFIYGITLSANYRGFDISSDLQGVYGNEIFRAWGNGNTFAAFNYRRARLERWTGPGTSNWEPQLNDTRAINKQSSTYMIEDGSYFRIRNLQLGYNFPPATLSSVNIRSLRMFLSVQNLKTFKRNSGFTPEFGGSATSFGIDAGSYPVPAIYSFGLNVTF